MTVLACNNKRDHTILVLLRLYADYQTPRLVIIASKILAKRVMIVCGNTQVVACKAVQ